MLQRRDLTQRRKLIVIPKMLEKKSLAYFQILILIVGTIAFIQGISAADDEIPEDPANFHGSLPGSGGSSQTNDERTPSEEGENFLVSSSLNPTTSIKDRIDRYFEGQTSAEKTAEGLIKNIPELEGFTYEKLPDGRWNQIDSISKTSKIVDDPRILKILNNKPGPLRAAWSGVTTVFGNALSAAAIGATIYGIGTLVFPEQKDAVRAVSLAVSGGVFAGKTIADILGKHEILGISGGTAGLIGGLIVGGIILYSLFNFKEQQQINFQCLPWQPQTGGENCEECGKDGFPCTEYQCRSLGQACQLINNETTDQGCIWYNRNDVIPPVIEPWTDALLDENYSYKPSNKIQNPADRGVFIRYNHDCIPAFTPFQFGIHVTGGGEKGAPERAVCKIDTQRKENFSDMEYYFGGSNLLRYNHTHQMSFPTKESLEAENLSLQNGGNFELYVRCQDANGNTGPINFVFQYCVEEGPDLTAPNIIGTNYDALIEVPVASNQTDLDLTLYVNEPAECRWSHDRDIDFNQMTETMECPTSVLEVNAEMLYQCTTTLNGIKDKTKNDFYFRCRDKPYAPESERNTNSKGFKFTVAGTQPLVIDSYGPNGTIKDSATTAKVTLTAETSAGYNEGQATCYYSSTQNDEDYTKFLETNAATHSQDLYLPSGNYKYYLRCSDAGGNVDQKEITFSVDVDNTPPETVRVYNDGASITIITSEKGQCFYSLDSCSYPIEDGVPMNSYEGLEHYADWDTSKAYHIKCEDKYGNQPLPNQCQIIVRAFEDFER